MGGEDRRRFAETIARRAIAASKAPETEVLITGGREAATRFADNGIHQNMTREGVEISIRVADGGRTARASTNKPDADSLAAAAEAALTIARRLEPRDDLLPVPEPFGEYPRTACWDRAT